MDLRRCVIVKSIKLVLFDFEQKLKNTIKPLYASFVYNNYCDTI